MYILDGFYEDNYLLLEDHVMCAVKAPSKAL
jgi:hypothetical protein